MSLVDDALALRRDALVAALYDQPNIRAKLDLAEITSAVDVAFASAAIPALLNALVAADQVVAAVVSDVPTPPASVTTAVGGYTPAKDNVRDHWGEFYNEP